jgi:dipeptidyl aminopeptidase/acylaminoacyl peptidase
MRVTIDQGLDRPPRLVASERATHRTQTIWDPNPQLRNMRIGPVTIYKWHDEAGHELTGGLVKPVDYVPGRRYPLVIQTHGFDGTEFLTDGVYSTASAARAMASRGLMVLQVREIADAFGTAEEAHVEGLPGYASAIEQLSKEGFVDPGKVGIIGFSRTGWYVLDSLIRAPQLFRAATLAEASYMSFGQYLLEADLLGPQRARDFTDAIGSEPYGRGLPQWLIESPGFNTDKIQAPVLFEANNPPALIYAWDIYAALRLQEKPVDLLYIRTGDHILRKPRELLASQEMTVDWYDFWLNDHEDADPSKTNQYTRWRTLRARGHATLNSTG